MQYLQCPKKDRKGLTIVRYAAISISDLPAKAGKRIKINGTIVHLTSQPIASGEKRLFLCPKCGARRGKLLLWEGKIGCRGCAPFDIYERRRNLYDSGGTALLEYQMMQLALKHRIEFDFPFDYYSQIMRMVSMTETEANKFRAVLVKMQMLENMRFSAIFFKKRYSAKDIKKFTAPEFTRHYTLQELRDMVFELKGD